MRKQNRQICIKLSDTLLAHLDDEARMRGRSVSNLIRRVLQDHAQEYAVHTLTGQAAEHIASPANQQQAA
jgi:metal-responsive CopG/Arc/MetJ family transcriptional regulator